jgi:hypothetical protein
MLWAKIVPLSHTPHRPSNEGDQDPIPLALHTQNYDAKDREEFEDANDHGNDGDTGESIAVTSWISDLSGPNLRGDWRGPICQRGGNRWQLTRHI